LSADSDLVAPGADQQVPVVRVLLREFTLPAPPPAAYHTAVRPDVRTDPVHGWLVGVTDGAVWGWWGPVDAAVAGHARDLMTAAFPDLPTWIELTGAARRLRRETRHAHTGLLALSVGALELALWDLAAKRADLPVWALLAPAPATERTAVYATCFGVQAVAERVTAVMEDVAATHTVQ
jgi:D-galactarolactone cycloisomerase